MPLTASRCRRCSTALVACAALVIAASAAHALAERIAPDRFAVTLSGQTLEIPIESTRPLTEVDVNVVRIVVVVHGSSQNAGEYRQRVEAAAARRPGELGRTLVVAPQFLEEGDVAHHGLPSRTLYWSDGWRVGEESLDTSAHPRPWTLSSYAVIDRLLAELIGSGRFPNLAAVVLAGHSGGAQFVHRYAASTAELDRHAGVAFRAVVANPGTYLYLGPERAVPNAPGSFAVPSAAERSACPGYDEYKYGLQDLFGYVAGVGAAQIVARYGRRDVRYLLGAEDTGSDSGLDTSCAARLQGDHRLERGNAYFAFLQHFYGASILDRHRRTLVSGVGHSASGMFQSDAGVDALFGIPAPAGQPPGAPPPEPLGRPGRPYVLD